MVGRGPACFASLGSDLCSMRGFRETTEERAGVDSGFLPCSHQAPCNLNLRSVSSLDIVIPGLNSSTDVQARIHAGESIHILRGTKGESGQGHPLPGERVVDWKMESVRVARAGVGAESSYKSVMCGGSMGE